MRCKCNERDVSSKFFIAKKLRSYSQVQSMNFQMIYNILLSIIHSYRELVNFNCIFKKIFEAISLFSGIESFYYDNYELYYRSFIYCIFDILKFYKCKNFIFVEILLRISTKKQNPSFTIEK